MPGAKNLGQTPTADALEKDTATTFAQDVLAELASGRYQYPAWQRFLSRSWARSIDDIRQCPARTRSFCLWTVAVTVTGFAVLLLAWSFYTIDLAVCAMVLWLPWLAASVFFVLSHLGMTDDDQGLPYNSLLLPNGLSYLRLALAPLVLVPFLGSAVHPVAGSVFVAFIASISISDMLDGWISRRRNICTRLGSMLDTLADLAFLTFLAVGLYQVDAIPAMMLWLLLIRYPLMLIGVLILYFTRGPAPITPTVIGKVTTFASSTLLLFVAFTFLVAANWVPSLWIDWSIGSLQILIAANILYLLYRGVTWKGAKKITNETPNH